VSLTVDVAVIGLGAAGSAAALSLARRGLRVVGFDRFTPPHPWGSTHGRSRVIREAYYESPVYVPLVQRARELWLQLERDSGRRLLQVTGGLMLGPPDGSLVTGSRLSAETHGLPFECLEGSELRRRFPIFTPGPGTVGLFEPRAGFLDPEAAVEAALTLARAAGADLRFGTVVEGWQARGDALLLNTSAGPVHAGRAVLAVGPWLGQWPGFGTRPPEVERQVMLWFTPRTNRSSFAAAVAPVFIWEWSRERFFYGIPDHGVGFKVARHHEGVSTTPETVDRTVREAEVSEIRELLARCIPDANGPLQESAVCLYTNARDRHFTIGLHPGEPRVVLLSPCSGHGFKFASVLGEVAADLATGVTPGFDLGPFDPRRPTA
jgi:sarcosine oxidase